MTAFEAYQFYKALHLHFTSPEYDYFKYHGRVKNTSKEKFDSSREKYWIEKLTKQYDKKIPSFLVANFSQYPNIYIRSLSVDPDCHKTYNEWSSLRKSFNYHFTSDLNKLSNDINEELNSNKQLPLLIRRMNRKEISKETTCIILREMKALPILNEELENDLLWDHYKLSIEKYMPFALKKSEYVNILLEKFGKIGYK